MKKILICDEDEKTREQLKLILNSHYELILVDDGLQVSHVLKNSPDVALAVFAGKTHTTQDMDSETEAIARHSQLKVIRVADYTSAKITKKSSQSNPDGYINRPIKAEDVLQKVRKILK